MVAVNCYCNYKITYQDAVVAVGKIKEHKSHVNYCLDSDHIVHGEHELYVHILILFNTMLSHSRAPSDMLKSALVNL